ncbi:MAG: FAD-binding oxidoreductase [Parvibaculales bacterium]
MAQAHHETGHLALAERFGPAYSTAQAVRDQHCRGEAHVSAMPPDAVVFAVSTEDVVTAVTICAEHRIPVIAHGTGTSLEGHINAVQGGVCIDLTGMNRILEVRSEDMDVRVQAGVTRKQLNTHLRDQGLFFPIDPGADASLGGMCATRASGTNAVRYGTMRDNVLNLTAVMADGTVVTTGRRARKSAAGYDLTRLLVGSEGTLGIITEVTLRLHGIPESIASAVCAFDTLEGAVQTTMETIQSGIPIARMELLDPLTIKAVNSYSKLTLLEAPHLFMEFHGSPASVEEQSAAVAELAAANGGSGFDWATLEEERNRLWQARHDTYYATRGLAPEKVSFSTDICVPISRLAACIAETHADIEELDLLAPIVGHVGDGNFHVIVLMDEADADEVERARIFKERLVSRALAHDGTCTGEHGVGMGKMAHLEQELGAGVALMRSIKKALDPDNILNPGKIFEPD